MTNLKIFNVLRLTGFALVLVSFGIMVAVSQIHGGGALGGKVVDGHYYLVNKRQVKEVAETAYRQVHLAELSCLSFFAFTFITSLVYVNLKRGREDYVPNHDWDKHP